MSRLFASLFLEGNYWNEKDVWVFFFFFFFNKTEPGGKNLVGH